MFEISAKGNNPRASVTRHKLVKVNKLQMGSIRIVIRKFTNLLMHAYNNHIYLTVGSPIGLGLDAVGHLSV